MNLPTNKDPTDGGEAQRTIEALAATVCPVGELVFDEDCNLVPARFGHCTKIAHHEAHAILAAIRDGRVPGLMTTEQHVAEVASAIKDERDHFLPELAILRARLCGKVHELDNGMRAEREVDVAALTADLAKAREEVADLRECYSASCAMEAKAIDIMDAAKRDLAARNAIIAATLSALPVGNLRAHTAESIPGRVDELVRRYAETDRLESERDALREEVAKLKDDLAKIQEMPRYAETPYHDHIIRRCDNCSGVDEIPRALVLVGLSNCRACVAEKALAAEKAGRVASNELLTAANKALPGLALLFLADGDVRLADQYIEMHDKVTAHLARVDGEGANANEKNRDHA